MGAQSNLVLADAIPANHTFVPQGSRTEGGVIVSLFEDRDHTSNALGAWSVVERFTKGTGRQVVDQMQYSLVIPELATVDGQSVILWTARAEVKYYLPRAAASTFTGRLAAMVASLTGHADIKANVTDRRAFW